MCCYVVLSIVLSIALHGYYLTVVAVANNIENNEEYSFSLPILKNLFQHEQELLKLFVEFQSQTGNGMKSIQSYLDHYGEIFRFQNYSKESDLCFKTDEKILEVIKNTLMIYHLTRRYAVDLVSVEKEVSKSSWNISSRLLNQLNILKKNITLPSHSDMEQAYEMILGLRQTYDLDVIELSKGKLNQMETKVYLSAQDCYEIGMYALKFYIYNSAIDFLHAALQLAVANPSKYSNETLFQMSTKLDEAITKHDNFLLKRIQPEPENHKGKLNSRKPLVFQNILVNSSSDSFKMRKLVIIKPKVYSLFDEINIYVSYEKLCRGEDQLKSLSSKATLRCYLSSKRHPFWIVSPLKIEVHNADPLIIQIYEVINDKEMTAIKNLAAPYLVRSKVRGYKESLKGETTRHRTSSSVTISNKNHPNFSHISKRIERITGLKVNSPSSAEDLVVVNYVSGGHYSPHTDPSHENNLQNYLTPFQLMTGDRIATFMMYLSDVELGGFTVFPVLGVTVKPIKGSALFWYNLHPDGSINRLTLHAGCPILYGIKWVANKWILSNDQMFIKKCSSRFH